MARPLLIVPGLGGSGPSHWQSVWESELPDATRVEQADWDQPHRDAWIAAVRQAIAAKPGSVVVAHSLGCILLAHLLAEHPETPVAAALLVAPADVERLTPAPECVRRFAPVPTNRLPFPSIVVASGNDPFASFARAESLAAAWGAELIDVGNAGHINVEAGFGPWAAGRAILDHLITRIDAGR
ncbi:MAG TPA: alpha/beta hydrolase [Alphaproteobacteria bacterium]|jgi:predicted alpha/beta hydrolase family esterase|nr:alpha/beta hydrolase [Alphaproteobacteria bacterium]